MADHDLQELVSNLQRIRIRGEIIEGTRSELIGRPVEVTIRPRGLEGGITTTTPAPAPVQSTPIPPPFVLSPLAASRLGRQPFSEPGTKVLGPRAIEYWGCGGGFVCVQALKEQYQDYVSPHASNRGFVRFEDFEIEDNVVVVKNQGTRSHAEWLSPHNVSALHLFSLIFTEYWSREYGFCSIWHKEETGWLERATTVVELHTKKIVDFEVATTIYQPAKPGRCHMWHLYAL